MKTFASWLLFASAFIMLTACTQDDDLSLSSSNQNVSLRTLTFSPCLSGQRILSSALPAPVLAYVAATYTNYTLSSIRRYDTPDGVRFSLEVEMVGPDVDILFNEAGEVIASGQSTSSQHIALSALPQSARDYLDANFAGQAIQEIRLKSNFGATLYYVELVNSTDIYFSTNGDFICADLDDSNGGGNGGGSDDNGGDDNGGNGGGSDDNGGDDNDDDDNDDDDNDDNGGHGNDDNGGDDNGGNGGGSDDDDDDNDDNGGHGNDDNGGDDNGGNGGGSDDNGGDDNGGNGGGNGGSTGITFSDLPESARNYVLANYNSAIVEEVKRQLLCNGTPVYKVGLEGPGLQGFYLFFSLSGDLLYTQRRISLSDLPVEVSMALTNQFVAFQVDGNKVSRQNFPDGTVRYEIRLRPNDGSEKRTVTFTPAGEVLCSYHD